MFKIKPESATQKMTGETPEVRSDQKEKKKKKEMKEQQQQQQQQQQ